MFNNYNKTDYFSKNIEEAILHLKSNDFESAYKYITLSLLGNESSPICHNLFGILFELKGDLRLAGKHYRASYSLDPTYKPASINLERITAFNYNLNTKNIAYTDNFNYSYIKYIKNIIHIKEVL